MFAGRGVIAAISESSPCMPPAALPPFPMPGLDISLQPELGGDGGTFVMPSSFM